MKEIKFKAKRIDTGEWVYGSHYKAREHHAIVETITVNSGLTLTEPRFHEVNPVTVCQFTGLRDKNGDEIYEGDKLSRINGYYTVVFDKESAGFKKSNGCGGILSLNDCECEVIGNIHNKERS